MTARPAIPIIALVGSAEGRAVSLAAERLGAWLSGADEQPWPVFCALADDVAAIAMAPVEGGAAPRPLLVSLMDAAERLDEPWDVTRQRTLALFTELTADPRLTVFVLTVFRHVAADAPPEVRHRLKRRIARLNLLAVELSHDLGVWVIDVDRALADVGARVLGADYRLGGEGANAAAAAIARTLLETGLDGYVPVAVQTAAEARMQAFLAAAAGRRAQLTVATAAVPVGRRMQLAEAASPPGDRAALLIKGVLAGRVPFGVGWSALARAASRRGAGGALRIAAAAAGRILRGEARRLAGQGPGRGR